MRDLHEARVLVVEDDHILREQLLELLERDGYRSVQGVGTVANADMAVRIDEAGSSPPT